MSCLLKWGELSSESGASCLGASFMWGELSWGELSLGRVVCNSFRKVPAISTFAGVRSTISGLCEISREKKISSIFFRSRAHYEPRNQPNLTVFH